MSFVAGATIFFDADLRGLTRIFYFALQNAWFTELVRVLPDSYRVEVKPSQIDTQRNILSVIMTTRNEEEIISKNSSPAKHIIPLYATQVLNC